VRVTFDDMMMMTTLL